MTGFATKKSEFSVTGYFRRPAFALLNPKTNLHSTVVAFLSDFCSIGGDDIRINQDASPLSNANVTYDLQPFNGFARVSIDRSQLVLIGPHTLTREVIAGLSLAVLNGVQSEIEENSYASYLIHIGLHAELQDADPAEHTGKFVVSAGANSESIIGNSVTYYLGQEGPRTHSSVVLDMSGEFSECVFLRLALNYDATRIALSELQRATIDHCDQLLALVGLDSVR